MKKQYLIDFQEDQLKKYLQTFKQRVSQMRAFTVQLERQNANLQAQYNRLVNHKKYLNQQTVHKKNVLLNWYDIGKKNMSNWVSRFKNEQKNSYEPEFADSIEDEKNKVEVKQKIENNQKQQSNENKRTFQGILSNGKQKWSKIVETGEAKIREITQSIKSKYKYNTNLKRQQQQKNIKQQIKIKQFEYQDNLNNTKNNNNFEKINEIRQKGYFNIYLPKEGQKQYRNKINIQEINQKFNIKIQQNVKSNS